LPILHDDRERMCSYSGVEGVFEAMGGGQAGEVVLTKERKE